MCSVVGCGRKLVARGLCGKHYQQGAKAGTLPPKTPQRTRCEVDGCDRPGPFRLGWCYMHRWRVRANGTTELRTIDERFDSWWVLDQTTGCHIWQGARHKFGYGRFRIDQKTEVRAHVFAFRRKYGPVPKGLVLDHFACDNPPCCNPDHVRPVTPRENSLRGKSPLLLHAHEERCRRGHLWSENSYWRPDGHGRMCKRCLSDRAKARAQRKAAASQDQPSMVGRPAASH
jgi:hypothetical protein